MSTANVSTLHKWHHDDYDEAKSQIRQSLGSIDDIEIFGRQVLVAVYVRPEKSANGLYMGAAAQREDVYQGKAMLVLKCGPDAFQGDNGYEEATFGKLGRPEPGDWVFARASSGEPLSLCGDGAERPTGATFGGEMVDIYGWDGWPCRLISDEAILGRMNKPHTIV